MAVPTLEVELVLPITSVVAPEPVIEVDAVLPLELVLLVNPVLAVGAVLAEGPRINFERYTGADESVAAVAGVCSQSSWPAAKLAPARRNGRRGMIADADFRV